MVNFGDNCRPSDLEPRTTESAVQRVQCTEGATSVFTALSTRLTLRLSALIILIHPSPLHPLRRTPALNTAHACHSVSTPTAVNPFPNALYKHIITKNGFICISKKYLTQRIDYNSSFEYICTIFGIKPILNLSKVNAVIHFVSIHLSCSKFLFTLVLERDSMDFKISRYLSFTI